MVYLIPCQTPVVDRSLLLSCAENVGLLGEEAYSPYRPGAASQGRHIADAGPVRMIID